MSTTNVGVLQSSHKLLHTARMTISPDAGQIPPWTRGDRLEKALKASGVQVQDMADYLGVSRQTLSSWFSGRTSPTTGVVRIWALRTGVPFLWLETGQAPGVQGPGGGDSLPQVDSNDQPFDWWSDYRSA